MPTNRRVHYYFNEKSNIKTTTLVCSDEFLFPSPSLLYNIARSKGKSIHYTRNKMPKTDLYIADHLQMNHLSTFLGS